MSISAVGSQPTSPQSRLLEDLQNSGLSTDKASMVASEIDTAVQSSKTDGTGRPDRASARAAIEKQLTADVASGKLSADDAALVRKTLDEFDKHASASQGTGKSSGNGGPPDPAELFSKLDTNNDGKLTRDEFVTSRPQNVSEDQAGQMYDSIANGNTDGLTSDQFVQGMKSQQPPAGGGGRAAPAGGGGGGGGDSSSSSSSSSKTEVSRTSTTQGSMKTTVITYSDGSKETTTSYSGSSSDSSQSSADTLQDLLKQLSSSDSSNAANYLKQLLAGGLVDTQA